MYSIMIRKNSLLCKLIRIKTSSKFLFDTFMAQFRPELETCPAYSLESFCCIPVSVMGLAKASQSPDNGQMTVFITGLPEKSVRTPQLRLMASAMMFPCNSSPQRSISVSSQMTCLLHLFCLMIRSARFARPIATKIIPAQKNKISASQINLFSMRWLLIDIHLMFSDTPCAVIKNVKTLKLLSLFFSISQ